MTALEVSESALLLGGFVLAHAAWSISDAPELLVPLAIVQRRGLREIIRFEGESQQEAIERGKAELSTLDDSVECCAFAREGLLTEDGGKIDVITVDIWWPNSSPHVTLVQRFEPYVNRQHFRLLGDPDVAFDGKVQQRATVRNLLQVVRRGISQHSKVAPLWHMWRDT